MSLVPFADEMADEGGPYYNDGADSRANDYQMQDNQPHGGDENDDEVNMLCSRYHLHAMQCTHIIDACMYIKS